MHNAHNNDNEMCATIFLLSVILSQCLFKENVHDHLLHLNVFLFNDDKQC